MSAGRVRVGVIGLGFGQQHMRAFLAHPGVDLVAICGTDRARTGAVAAEFGVPRAYDDYERMLHDAPIDAVSIVSPPHLHRPMAVAAFAAGKHVLCEKPLAGSLADARIMVERARASGLIHGMNQPWRTWPGSRLAKELLDRGAIGRPYSLVDSGAMDVESYYAGAAKSPNKLGWFSRRERGGGFVLSGAQHLWDRLIWLFGPVHSVMGEIHTAVPRVTLPDGRTYECNAPDSAHGQVRFASGLMGLVHYTPGHWPRFWTRLEVIGDQGALLLERKRSLHRVQLARRPSTEYQDVEIPASPVAVDLPPEVNPHLFETIDHFVRAVQTGTPMSPSFDDGLATQELIEALMRSSETGTRQTLPLPS